MILRDTIWFHASVVKRQWIRQRWLHGPSFEVAADLSNMKKFVNMGLDLTLIWFIFQWVTSQLPNCFQGHGHGPGRQNVPQKNLNLTMIQTVNEIRRNFYHSFGRYLSPFVWFALNDSHLDHPPTWKGPRSSSAWRKTNNCFVLWNPQRFLDFQHLDLKSGLSRRQNWENNSNGQLKLVIWEPWKNWWPGLVLWLSASCFLNRHWTTQVYDDFSVCTFPNRCRNAVKKRGTKNMTFADAEKWMDSWNSASTETEFSMLMHSQAAQVNVCIWNFSGLLFVSNLS